MVDGQRLTAVQKFMFELTLVVLTDRRRQFADVDISNHFYAETTVFLATYVYLRFGRSRDLRFSRFWGTLWSESVRFFLKTVEKWTEHEFSLKKWPQKMRRGLSIKCFQRLLTSLTLLPPLLSIERPNKEGCVRENKTFYR
jgi:hypothetical protein